MHHFPTAAALPTAGRVSSVAGYLPNASFFMTPCNVSSTEDQDVKIASKKQFWREDVYER
jgi:hypothetical protein